MELSELLTLAGTGGAASLIFQGSKGSWNRWLTLAVAVAVGFTTGAAQGGTEGGLVSALAMLATHSSITGTPFGEALKVGMAPRFLRLVAEIASNLAKAIENKPPSP